jgi:hypothetical protein
MSNSTNTVGYFNGKMVGWFSPGTLASFTTKTGHHDIAEILLKVALNTISNQIVTLPLFYKFHLDAVHIND